MSALPRMNWLRWWWPALVWAGMIFSSSTDAFSGENTSRILIPFLHRLFPAARWETLATAHLLIRKSAHVTEYFLFGILIVRGIRAGRRGWDWRWTLAALAAAAGWAALDELHQSFVPSRGPSMIDVLIDFSGALFGQIVFAAVATLRARRAAGTAGVDTDNLTV